MTNTSPTTDLHHLRRGRILRTALSGLVAKAAFLLSALIISRIAISQLGSERFGVLMTVLSLMAFLAMADLGVGSSLVTSLSRALGAGDYKRVRQQQMNGLAVVSAMAILIFALGVGAYYLDLGTIVFPASGQSVRREATIAISVFVMLFGLSLPVTLIVKIQLGLQRGHVANQWQALAAIINLACGTIAAIYFNSVPLVVLGMMVGTMSCGMANASIHILGGDPKLRPSAAEVERGGLIKVLRSALFYLALQIIFTITYASDTLIIARILGAEQASVFALSERVFSLVAIAVAIVSGPLWAAYGDAIGAADEKWATSTLRLSTVRIGISSIIISLIILSLLQPIISLLSAGNIEVPFSLGIAMSCWRIVEAVGASVSIYLFAREAIKISLVMGACTALSSIVAKILFLHHAGIILMPIATTVCYTVCCLLPSLYYIRQQDRARRISL